MTDHPIKGLRYPAALDERSGQFAGERDYEEYVRQVMRQLLMTSPGERIMRPEFGCGLRQMLFTPLSQATAPLVEAMVREAVDSHLGDYVQLESVRVTTAGERLEVAVHYRLRGRGKPQRLDLEVSA